MPGTLNEILRRIFRNPTWKHPVTNMLLGVVGSLLTAFFLNLAHLIEVRLPKTESLNNFGSVIKKAAQVIETSDKAIYFATDVPAMGAFSQRAAFQDYAEALRHARSRETNTHQLLDITWLKRADEVAITKMEGLSPEQAERVLADSDTLRRDLAGRMVKERTLPSLMFFYFWTGENKAGNVGSVIAFNEGVDPAEPVKGFYTNSPDVHTVLKRVQSVLASDKLEKEVLSAYSAVTGCRTP
jgi:hypothetical protein